MAIHNEEEDVAVHSADEEAQQVHLLPLASAPRRGPDEAVVEAPFRETEAMAAEAATFEGVAAAVEGGAETAVQEGVAGHRVGADGARPQRSSLLALPRRSIRGSQI